MMKEWATARQHVLDMKTRDPKAAEKLDKEITMVSVLNFVVHGGLAVLFPSRRLQLLVCRAILLSCYFMFTLFFCLWGIICYDVCITFGSSLLCTKKLLQIYSRRCYFAYAMVFPRAFKVMKVAILDHRRSILDYFTYGRQRIVVCRFARSYIFRRQFFQN
jgi:hypothetical protein